MLINNINSWFNNPSSHYSSQPNFNLSDYQQIDQTSNKNSEIHTSENSTRTLKPNFNRSSFNQVKKNSTNNFQKRSNNTPVFSKYSTNQPQIVKKQIKNAFQSKSNNNFGSTKSRSTLNANSDSTAQINTEISDLTSKTCTNFNQVNVDATSTDKTTQNGRAKSSSQLDLSSAKSTKSKSNTSNVHQLLMTCSNNPFNSNYDFACKNTNSQTDWSTRFANKTRINPNLSILDYKLHNNTNNNQARCVRPATAGNSKSNYDLEYKNYLKKLFEIFKMNEMDENLKTEDIEKKIGDSMFGLYYVTPSNKLEKSKTTNLHRLNAANEIKNYFLNYRSIPINKKDEDQQNQPVKPIVMVRTSEAPPPKIINSDSSRVAACIKQLTTDPYMHLNTTKTSFTERVQNRAKTAVASPAVKNANLQLEEHRKRNGPEKYLEPLKVIDIKKWIEQVDRVQSVEGKCLETISKIRFYND